MHDNFEHNEALSMEERLTAVLMGEANAAMIAEVEAALAVDAELRARRDNMIHTLGLLKQSPPMVSMVALQEASRNALRAAAQQQLQQRRPRRWRPTPLWSAAALLLLVSGVAYFQQDSWLAPASHVDASAPSGPSAELESLGKTAERDLRGGLDGKDFVKGDRYKGPADVAPPENEYSLIWEGRVEPLEQLGYAGDGEVQVLELQRELSTKGSAAQAPAPSSVFHVSAPKQASPPSTQDKVVRREAGSALSPLPPAEDMARLEPQGLVSRFARQQQDNPSAGAYFEDFGSQDLRARTENILDAVNPHCVVVDGYGRSYVNKNVLVYLRPAYQGESPRDMFFRYYGDNPAVITKLEPISTFAADVDTASYPMARNYLVNGNLPPKQSIRTEEFVNYFDYELAAPTEGDFAVRLQAMPSLFGGDSERTLLAIGIKAREVLDENRKPMNLVFVIDKSGSMAGARMQLVKDSLELLVDQMRQDDTLGIVTFDSHGHIMLPPTSARERWKLREVIRNLDTGGSTNAAEGLAMGYKMIETCFAPERINRLVLASDGVANTGEVDQERILATVRAQAEADVDLTTLGVGMGNHNDVFLEQLADKGDGSCHYIDDYAEAKHVLVEQFLGTMVTIARDVKIQVEFDSKVVTHWRQLGYENRALSQADFRNDAIDAGEVGSGHEVSALYELQTVAGADANGKLITVRLRWFPDGSTQAVEQEFQLTLGSAVGRWGLAPARLRLAAVVAQYAEVLRRSHHAREDSYQTLREEVAKLVKELPEDQDVAELRDMIERTVELARWSPPQDELSILVESMRERRLQAAQLRFLGEQNGETALLLAAIERQTKEIEGRLLELLED